MRSGERGCFETWTIRYSSPSTSIRSPNFGRSPGNAVFGTRRLRSGRIDESAEVDLLVAADAADEHQQVDPVPTGHHAVLGEELVKVGEDFRVEAACPGPGVNGAPPPDCSGEGG